MVGKSEDTFERKKYVSALYNTSTPLSDRFWQKSAFIYGNLLIFFFLSQTKEEISDQLVGFCYCFCCFFYFNTRIANSHLDKTRLSGKKG